MRTTDTAGLRTGTALPPRNSLRVRTSIALLERRLSRAAGRIWSAPDLRRVYPEYLVMLHSMVRASVPLMADALARAELTAGTDPVHARLVDYFRHHIVEESGHDEWILEDLEALGVPRARALEQLPRHAVAELVGAQYYYIRHYDPVCLLGYIATIEGYPPGEDLARDCAARSGYPLEGFRTVRKHANLDPFHKSALDDFLDSLPLTGRQLVAVNSSAIRTMAAVIEVLDELAPPARKA
ncbi:hypothetical protein GCM10009760_14950 [Kitasatospora kazusensis]|uniref:Iron-containing redox enzyme family protein n=1 Tax=Kitasatospora kazusensis TaxID=407974 RepID=A0ABN2Z2R0_9ACTN